MIARSTQNYKVKDIDIDSVNLPPTNPLNMKLSTAIVFAASLISIFSSGCAFQRGFFNNAQSPTKPAAGAEWPGNSNTNNVKKINPSQKNTLEAGNVYGAILISVYGDATTRANNCRENCLNEAKILARCICNETHPLLGSLGNSIADKKATEGCREPSERNVMFVNTAIAVVGNPDSVIKTGEIRNIRENLIKRYYDYENCNNIIWQNEVAAIKKTLTSIDQFLAKPDDKRNGFLLAQNLVETIGIGNLHDKYLAARKNDAYKLADVLLSKYQHNDKEMQIYPDLIKLKNSFMVLSTWDEESAEKEYRTNPEKVLIRHKQQLLDCYKG